MNYIKNKSSLHLHGSTLNGMTLIEVLIFSVLLSMFTLTTISYMQHINDKNFEMILYVQQQYTNQ